MPISQWLDSDKSTQVGQAHAGAIGRPNPRRNVRPNPLPKPWNLQIMVYFRERIPFYGRKIFMVSEIVFFLPRLYNINLGLRWNRFNEPAMKVLPGSKGNCRMRIYCGWCQCELGCVSSNGRKHKPHKTLNITVANTRTETTRFGVGGSTQNLLQGLKILSIS